MRTALPSTAALQGFLAANNTGWRGDLYELTTADGAVYRWTSADGNLVYGGNIFYTPGINAPVVVRTGYNSAARLVVDTLDLTLTGGGFKILGKPLPQQAVLGYFQGARLRVHHAIGRGPNEALAGASGINPTVNGGLIDSFFEGRVATVEPQGGSVVLRCKSELDALNVLLPKFPLQPQCGNAVYDANCGLSRAAFTVAGAADGSPTKTSIHTSSAAVIANGAGYYNLGVLQFTSGANNGQKRCVQSWDGATFTMALPFASAPKAGDTFTVYPGCDRSEARCLSPFNNLAQFRGAPHIPAPEAGGN